MNDMHEHRSVKWHIVDLMLVTLCVAVYVAIIQSGIDILGIVLPGLIGAALPYRLGHPPAVIATSVFFAYTIGVVGIWLGYGAFYRMFPAFADRFADDSWFATEFIIFSTVGLIFATIGSICTCVIASAKDENRLNRHG